jgi:hypothetical protein
MLLCKIYKLKPSWNSHAECYDWEKFFLHLGCQQSKKLYTVLLAFFLFFVSNLMAAPGPSRGKPVRQKSERPSVLIELGQDPLSIIMSHLGPTDLRSFAQVNKYVHQGAAVERDKRYSLEIIDDTVIISKHSAKGPPQMAVQFLLSHLSDGNHHTPQHDNLKLLAKLIDQSPQSLVISGVKILGKEVYPSKLGAVLETIETDLLPALKRKFPAIEIDSQLHFVSQRYIYRNFKGNSATALQEAANFFLEQPRDTKLVLTGFPLDKINLELDPASKAAIDTKGILTSESAPLDLRFLRGIYDLTAADLADRLRDPGEQDLLRRKLGVGFSDVLWRDLLVIDRAVLDLAHVPGGQDVQKMKILLNYEPTGLFKHAVLLKAIEYGSQELVELLLGAGAPLEFDEFFEYSGGSSALAVAVGCNNLSLVKLLLAFGAPIKKASKYDEYLPCSAIQLAVRKADSPANQATRNLILIELLKSGDFDFQNKGYQIGEATLAEVALDYANQGALQIIQNAWQVQQAAHVGQSFPICRPESSLHVTPFSKIFDILRMGAQPAL